VLKVADSGGKEQTDAERSRQMKICGKEQTEAGKSSNRKERTVSEKADIIGKEQTLSERNSQYRKGEDRDGKKEIVWERSKQMERCGKEQTEARKGR